MRAWRVGPIPAEVTLDEVKRNARVTHDDDDLLIQQFIDAAHVRAEEETGRVFGAGQWIIAADDVADRIIAPIYPVTAAPVGWTIETYGRGAVLVAGEWPVGGLIEVTAGETMPAPVRQAVLMLATYWYDHRAAGTADGAQDLPYATSALLGLSRRMFA